MLVRPTVEADVLAVGGGFAGTQAALAAAQDGAHVAVSSAGGSWPASQALAAPPGAWAW